MQDREVGTWYRELWKRMPQYDDKMHNYSTTIHQHRDHLAKDQTRQRYKDSLKRLLDTMAGYCLHLHVDLSVYLCASVIRNRLNDVIASLSLVLIVLFHP
jgi:hypothetical protein